MSDLSDLAKWIIMFVMMFCLDVVWARYTQHVVRQHALRASTLAALLIVLNGVNVIAYTADHVLLIPAAAGAFAGTFVATVRTWKSLL